MRVLLAASEVYPFSKTGGLADMTAGLTKALARLGHEAVVVSPFYRCARKSSQLPELEPWGPPLRIPLDGYTVEGRALRGRLAARITICFIEQPGFFDRPGLYDEIGAGRRAPYPDNAERFIFFSKAVARLAREGPERMDVVHTHDWQTGLVPLLVRHETLRPGWIGAPRTVHTIHNLAYQGLEAAWKYALTNLPPYYFHPDGAEFYGKLSLLKAGIAFADAVTTVSPGYAREILNPEFGMGLEGALQARGSVLRGILNGVDTEMWKTRGNPHLPFGYDARRLEGKARVKRALQAELGLREADVPLFGTVSRLELQKGIDLALEVLPWLTGRGAQYALLGSGDPELAARARELAGKFPGRFAFVEGYNEPLAHRIEAGADFYLMPSRFEPCGLNQMYSLRYGTPPVVRAVGGLNDAVVDAAEDPKRANGFKFGPSEAEALRGALERALGLWRDPEALRQYRIRGMRADFSWRRAAREYAALYRELLGR